MNAAHYVVLSAIGSAVTTLVGVWAYRRRAMTDVEARRDSAELDADAREEQLLLKAREAAQEALKEPLRILEKELAKREAELAAIRAKDDMERAKYLETLGAMRNALEAIAKDLREHRDEEKVRTGSLHTQLGVLDRRMLVLETRMGIAPGPQSQPPEAAP